MKRFNSIKWQLLVWQTVLLAGVLVTLMTLHYQFQKRDLIAAVDADLQETLLAVMPILAPPPQGGALMPASRTNHSPLEGPQQVAARLLQEIEQHNVYILSTGARGIKQYGQVPVALMEQPPAPVDTPVQITRAGNRERIHPHHNLTIVIGQSLDDVNAEMATVLGILFLIGGGVLVFGVAIGWVIVSRSLRPIHAISQTAETIAKGEHHKRVELSDAPNELASLAQTLNESFDHLDEAIEIQKRFTADASHELRTPVAVVIAQAEAALKNDRSTDEYKSVLEACLRAGRRMKAMAESLLELTRLDSHGISLSKKECDLNDVVSGAVDSGSLLSEKHPVNLQPAETPVQAEIDRDRIHQVITNLIANAVQHNPDGCEINVSLTERGVITVCDNGIGIPDESLPYIFDRFYRVDKSRSRERGGAGLGLSIVQRLVEAHGGTITARSGTDDGANFTVTLQIKTQA